MMRERETLREIGLERKIKIQKYTKSENGE